MANPYKKIRVGDTLDGIPGAAWNKFIDTAQFVDQQRFQGQEGRIPPSPFGTVIKVRNGSGGDLNRFDVLQITTPIFLPSDGDGSSFNDQRWLNGDTPSIDSGALFAILQEPIADGRIGRAMISGVTPCKLHITYEAQQFADLKDDDASQLQTCQTGRAQILWKASGTGEDKDALVYLNQSPVSLITAQADDFALSVDDVDFTPSGTTETVKGDVRKGLVMPGREYLLAGAGGNLYVLNPELTVIGTPDDYYHAGELADFEVTG